MTITRSDRQPLSLVIDTDTAADDATALLLAAAQQPSVTIAAVTTVAGNVSLDQATKNALSTLHLAGLSDVAVHPGCASPSVGELDLAHGVHGADGLSGARIQPSPTQPDSTHAVEALVSLARTEPGVHTLVTLGPLTNIAAAIALEPELLTMFRHTYMMAGAPDAVGNVNAFGEFNVWTDPPAASVVLNAEGPKTMIGWNVSRKYAVVSADQNRQIEATGPVGAFVVAANKNVAQFCKEVTGLDGYDLPDPVAMAVALDETLITESSTETLVVGIDGPTRGATLCDRRANAPRGNCRVVWAVDSDRFIAQVIDACETLQV